MNSRISCVACGAPIEPFETITVTGRGDHCYSCFNRMIASRLGVAFDDTPLEPISIADADGGSHNFAIRSRLAATGRVMEALEVTVAGRPVSPGYRFQVLGDHESDAWNLFRCLHAKMRREMAVRHVELTDLGWQIGQNQRLVGRIEWDADTDGAVPLIVVDGKPFTWEQVGRMLMTFEGFTIDARIEDSIEVVDRDK